MKIIDDVSWQKVYREKYALDAMLPPAILEAIELVQYDREEHLFEAGAPLEYFYFFLEGKLKLYQIHENGRALLIQFYDHFNSLGEVELMTDVACTCSVVTVKPTVLARVPMALMRTCATDYAPFLRYVVRSLSDKLITSERHHSYNLLYPVKNRLASYLMAYVDTRSKIVLSHSLQDVSEFIGTTYRQVHRAFQALEAEGVLSREGKCIDVLDKAALAALAGHIYHTM